MMSKLRASRERDERGFTLIELLVVILIIAILAAIAIPVFLRQREKGWIAQNESALKNAAIAAESFATGNQGSYDGMVLATEGFKPTIGVTVTVLSDSVTDYCISANHDKLAVDYFISSATGKPDLTPCT